MSEQKQFHPCDSCKRKFDASCLPVRDTIHVKLHDGCEKLMDYVDEIVENYL